MRLTKSKLKQLIKEEISSCLKEMRFHDITGDPLTPKASFYRLDQLKTVENLIDQFIEVVNNPGVRMKAYDKLEQAIEDLGSWGTRQLTDKYRELFTALTGAGLDDLKKNLLNLIGS